MATDLNFQDIVVLNQDTLSVQGASINVGSSTATTVGFGLTNSVGAVALQAAPAAGTITVWLPASSGTLLTNINVSAGTTSLNLSAITFSNSNGISFGLNGGTLTASAVASPMGIAAGTQTATSGTVVFVNSNGVTFGMSGSSAITASYTQSTSPAAISAGTTSASSGTIVFSNSNNVSFGMNGNTVTASATVASSQGSINFSAGTTSQNLSAITFSNSNGVSFGLNGSTLTASIATSLSAINLSAGTTSQNLSAFTLSNSNNVSFGLNGSTVTASAQINVSAGTTSQNLSALTFSNSNGVSFGLNGSTLSASIASSIGMFSQDVDFVTNFQFSQATMSIQKVSFPMYLSATQLGVLMDIQQQTAGANSTRTGALTISHAVYTLNGLTASLASSGSREVSWASGSQTTASSIYGGISGTRYRTIGVNYSLTPGDYLFAWIISSNTAISGNVFGRAAANIVGTFDGFETNRFLNGSSASSTSAFPTSIVATNTNYARTGAPALRQPGAIFVG